MYIITPTQGETQMNEEWNKFIEDTNKYLEIGLEPPKIQGKALVLLSGGMDSTTALYWARKCFLEVEAISFTYGSKHNDVEGGFAQALCDRLSINRTVIDLDFMKQLHSSLLKGSEEVPEGAYNDKNMASTVVPFRNGVMLAIAAAFADDRKMDAVVLGNHAGDHFIYPDCRPTFIEGMAQAVLTGTTNHVVLLSPFCNKTKTDIVRYGSILEVDFKRTWSCYKGGGIHCGKCGTCDERKKAFAEAGIEDPTLYLA